MASAYAYSCIYFSLFAWIHPLVCLITRMHEKDVTIWTSLKLLQTESLFLFLPCIVTFLKHEWFGRSNRQSNLSVLTLFPPGPPGPPGVVIVEEITDTTATLSWTRGPDNHSPISTYNLQARSPFSLGWQTVKTGNQ